MILMISPFTVMIAIAKNSVSRNADQMKLLRVGGIICNMLNEMKAAKYECTQTQGAGSSKGWEQGGKR